MPNDQHLARYRVADLALDTFPYTSHTTATDHTRGLPCGAAALSAVAPLVVLVEARTWKPPNDGES